MRNKIIIKHKRKENICQQVQNSILIILSHFSKTKYSNQLNKIRVGEKKYQIC